MKVNKKMLKEFLDLMEDFGEFVFGDEKQIKKQLELCLNTQGYWSGNTIKVYYNNGFRVENRF
jgi:hypothetical protein